MSDSLSENRTTFTQVINKVDGAAGNIPSKIISGALKLVSSSIKKNISK